MHQSSSSTSGLMKSQVIQITRQPGQLLGLAGAAGLLVLIAALASMAFVQGTRNGSMEVTPREIREIPGFGFAFAQLLLGSTIITLVTTEWTSGSILGTVATTQRRSALVVAKAVVGAGAALAALLVGAICSLVLASTVLSTGGLEMALTSSSQWKHVVGLTAAGVLSTVLAVGVAFAMRRTAAAIVTYIALVMVAPIALGMVPWTPLMKVASLLPLNASGYMMSTGAPPDTGLSVAGGYVAMSAWAAAGLAIGWWRMVRTDV